MNRQTTQQSPTFEYWVDVAQRTILFWDVLRRRSAAYYEQRAKPVPHVLTFDAELVVDGRTFDRPANYLLVRIKPPAGVRIDPKKRPFVVVDPRAGHGPGIGGFKADSELGVAMSAGHPACFVGFTPEPMPGQTIEDIMRAEAIFLEKVIELHPDAGKRAAPSRDLRGGGHIEFGRGAEGRAVLGRPQRAALAPSDDSSISAAR